MDALRPGLLGPNKDAFAHRCSALGNRESWGKGVCQEACRGAEVHVADCVQCVDCLLAHGSCTPTSAPACLPAHLPANRPALLALTCVHRYCDRRLVPARGRGGNLFHRWDQGGGSRLYELHGLLVREVSCGLTALCMGYEVCLPERVAGAAHIAFSSSTQTQGSTCAPTRVLTPCHPHARPHPVHVPHTTPERVPCLPFTPQVMIRRLKKDVMAQLPPKRRQVLAAISVAEGVASAASMQYGCLLHA